MPGMPEDHALEGGRHRAGVGDVVAEVRPVVDAGDDQVGREAVDQPERGEPDAVDRRAVGRVADRAVAERHLLDPQRPPRGDRARGGRLVGVGRDDRELDVVDLEQRAPQRLQALRLDPVVVGEEDPEHAREDRCGLPTLAVRPVRGAPGRLPCARWARSRPASRSSPPPLCIVAAVARAIRAFRDPRPGPLRRSRGQHARPGRA